MAGGRGFSARGSVPLTSTASGEMQVFSARAEVIRLHKRRAYGRLDLLRTSGGAPPFESVRKRRTVVSMRERKCSGLRSRSRPPRMETR